MVLRVLVGTASVAVLLVSTIWLSDRTGLTDRLTAERPWDRAETNNTPESRCRSLISEWGSSADSVPRTSDRRMRAIQQEIANCRDLLNQNINRDITD